MGKIVSGAISSGVLIAIVKWVAGIVAVIAARYYTRPEDFGPRGEIKRQFQEAASRLAMRKTRSEVEEVVLSGYQLAQAREQAYKAIKLIWQEANENLAILAERRAEPTPRMDISRIKRFFLAYEPRYGNSEYITRAMYWFLLLCLAGLLCLAAWTAWHYVHFNAQTKIAFQNMLLRSPKGRLATYQYLSLTAVLTVEAVFFWWTARRERPPFRKLRMPSQL